MFRRSIHIQRFQAKLTWWMDRPRLRLLFSMLSLCLLSDILLFPRAVRACEPIERWCFRDVAGCAGCAARLPFCRIQQHV